MDENKQQIADETTPEVNPEDQSLQEIIAKANELDEAQEKEEEKTDDTAEKTAETAQPEPPVETPREEPKPEPPQPTIDEEKLTTNIVNKVLEATKQSNTKEEQDELTKELADLTMRAKAEGREITYQEALKVVSTHATRKAKEEIMAELQAEADEEDRKEAEARQQQEQAYKENEANWNNYWDTQLKELEEAGKIPVGAEGKDIRIELFETMKKVAQERQAKGLQPILNLKEIYAFHYTPKQEPAGKTAPVAGSERSISNTPNIPSDAQLHTMDISDVMRVAAEIDNS